MRHAAVERLELRGGRLFIAARQRYGDFAVKQTSPPSRRLPRAGATAGIELHGAAHACPPKRCCSVDRRLRMLTGAP